MLRTWTTTLFLVAALLVGCGDDDGDGDGDSSAADGGGGDGEDGGGGGDDAGDSVDTDAAPDFEGIPCADDTCTAGEEVCCAGEGGLTCEAECGTISFGCDGPEDCTTDGEVCCGTGQDGTQCSPAADCGGGGEGDIVCHAEGDCPDGEECCMPEQAQVGVCRASCGGPA
jgi:hypothetical protein